MTHDCSSDLIANGMDVGLLRVELASLLCSDIDLADLSGSLGDLDRS